jgi:hypothetical protein
VIVRKLSNGKRLEPSTCSVNELRIQASSGQLQIADLLGVGGHAVANFSADERVDPFRSSMTPGQELRYANSLEFAGKSWAGWLASWLKLVASTGGFTKN